MEPVTIMLVEDEGLLLFEFEKALTEAGFNGRRLLQRNEGHAVTSGAQKAQPRVWSPTSGSRMGPSTVGR